MVNADIGGEEQAALPARALLLQYDSPVHVHVHVQGKGLRARKTSTEKTAAER